MLTNFLFNNEIGLSFTLRWKHASFARAFFSIPSIMSAIIAELMLSVPFFFISYVDGASVVAAVPQFIGFFTTVCSLALKWLWVKRV